jgi:hypothetical protein
MPSVAGVMDRMKEPAAIPTSPTTVMRGAPKRSATRPAGTPVSAATSGPTDKDEPDESRVEPERTGEIERPTTSVAIITVETSALMARLALSTGSRNIANRIKGDAALASASTKRPTPKAAADSRATLSGTETAAPDRHGERIGRERQGEQQRAHSVEAGPIRLRPPAIDGQVAAREKKGQDTQRHVDEEDRPPTEAGDQNAAERRAEGGADRRHRSEQPHGAAGPRLRDRLADERHGEGHHDGRPEALRRPGGDQRKRRLTPTLRVG